MREFDLDGRSRRLALHRAPMQEEKRSSAVVGCLRESVGCITLIAVDVAWFGLTCTLALSERGRLGADNEVFVSGRMIEGTAQSHVVVSKYSSPRCPGRRGTALGLAFRIILLPTCTNIFPFLWSLYKERGGLCAQPKYLRTAHTLCKRENACSTAWLGAFRQWRSIAMVLMRGCQAMVPEKTLKQTKTHAPCNNYLLYPKYSTRRRQSRNMYISSLEPTAGFLDKHANPAQLTKMVRGRRESVGEELATNSGCAIPGK